MTPENDIIPISSRRLQRPVAEVARPPSTARRRRVPPGGALIASAVGGLVLVSALAIGQWRGIDRLRSLPPDVRASTYDRALEDLALTCVPIPDGDGPLPHHCREQAQFLVMFPECAGECRRLVEPFLPHARR